LLSDSPRPQRRGLLVDEVSLAEVPLADLPLALARLHRATLVGDTLVLEPPPDLPPAPSWADLVLGAGFVPADESARPNHMRRARTLPDTVGPGMRALVCGLNPSLVAADAGYGYAGPSNRFWPAALAAGLVSRRGDPLAALLDDGVGMTDLVKRATASAGALAADEYRAGAARVGRLVEWLRPGRILFVGLSGWRAAVDKRAEAGWQPSGFGGIPAYVMPSTSGLNAHASRAVLVGHMDAALKGVPPPVA
jgi:TDG/mug DNA glycosylase family protein